MRRPLGISDERLSSCLMIVGGTVLVSTALFLWWLVLTNPVAYLWCVLGACGVALVACFMLWTRDRRRKARKAATPVIPRAVARERVWPEN